MIRNGLRVRAKVNKLAMEAGADSASPIDADLVRELALLVTESDLAEIEIQKGDLRIRLTRHHPVQAGPVAMTVAEPTVAPPAATPQAVAAVAASAPEPDHPGLLKSPMVGTVYRRANPESKAFVELNAAVKAGDRVLLVEAMKTFNDIVAHRTGIISAILIEDGQPVEFGEPLLLIE